MFGGLEKVRHEQERNRIRAAGRSRQVQRVQSVQARKKKDGPPAVNENSFMGTEVAIIVSFAVSVLLF